jgi:MinD superfamily P-loop ATPase
MDAYQVGDVRFCFACGRRAKVEYLSSPDAEPDPSEAECTGCERPAVACPCEPVDGGPL